MDFKLKLLTNVVIHQQEKIQELESKLTMAYSREIRANLTIDGLDEQPGENRAKLLEVVEEFFKNEMEIDEEIEIQDVYRVGKGLSRSVKIKLHLIKQSYSHMYLI